MPNPPTTPSTPKSPSDPSPPRADPDMPPTSTPPPPTPPPPTTADLTALLLDVLRNVNREVNVTLALSDKAQAAVAHFQAISADLRTLADGPTSFTTSTSTGVAKQATAAARR